MSLRPGSLTTAAAILFAVVVLIPTLAGAQQQGGECDGVPHCGPYNEDPGEGCNGPNDPFCTGGGGGEPYSTCSICFRFPEGPEGQPAEYECLDINGSPRLRDCEAFLNGCDSIGYCYLV